MQIPPEPNSPYVRVIPLGGLDQFGMNCCLIETGNELIMVDCGLTFPDQGQFGIDYILPDWTYVLQNLDRLSAIVLTHGHEDHIGALPFLLSQVEIPLYGGELTLAMVKRKLEEADVEDVEYNIVEPGDQVTVGKFGLEFIHVNHSIPNAMSVAINTELGVLVFTGDWKLDQTPIGEAVMDLHSLAKIGENGVLALLGDSTNVMTPGFSRSETEVVQEIASILETARGRVFVSLFSSNMNRVAAILEAADRVGRQAALVGRSLERNFRLASETGFIPEIREGILTDVSKLDKLPDDEVCILTTGTQAEPRSTLTRLAFDDHHQLSLRETDTVLISARVIPGNEAGVNKMLDALSRKHLTIITKADRPIHGSGHAHREELKLLLNLVRPSVLVPMHGDYRVRQAHADLAVSMGCQATVISDGDVLEFTETGHHVVGTVPSGRLAVDGKFMGDIDDVQIRDRKRLANTGIVVAFLVLDKGTGEIEDGPMLLQHGFLAGVPENEDLMQEATDFARNTILGLSKEVRRDVGEVSEELRLAVRRYFRKQLDRKPVVIPVVHEL